MKVDWQKREYDIHYTSLVWLINCCITCLCLANLLGGFFCNHCSFEIFFIFFFCFFSRGSKQSMVLIFQIVVTSLLSFYTEGQNWYRRLLVWLCRLPYCCHKVWRCEACYGWTVKSWRWSLIFFFFKFAQWYI